MDLNDDQTCAFHCVDVSICLNEIVMIRRACGRNDKSNRGDSMERENEKKKRKGEEERKR